MKYNITKMCTTTRRKQLSSRRMVSNAFNLNFQVTNEGHDLLKSIRNVVFYLIHYQTLDSSWQV